MYVTECCLLQYKVTFFSSSINTKSSPSLSTANGLPTFSPSLFHLADYIPLTDQPFFHACGSSFVLTFFLLVVQAVKFHNLDTSLFKAEFWDKLCDVIFQEW